MALAEPPFRFGQIVSHPHFIGRESELAALVTDLAAGVNVVVIAPRRYGKSSLVVNAGIKVGQPDGLSRDKTGTAEPAPD